MTARRPLPVLLLALAAVLVLSLASPPAADAARRGKGKSRPAEELINPLLAPELSLWLVGPISRMATEEEIEAYTSLVDDTAARAFIEEFWRRRDPDPRFAENPLRETFEERAAAADRLFTEAGARGRSTDRGTLYVLYGPPGEEDFDISDHRDDPPILVWKYPKGSPEGLDGTEPERFYRFIKRGEKTLFFTPNRRPQRPRPGPP